MRFAGLWIYFDGFLVSANGLREIPTRGIQDSKLHERFTEFGVDTDGFLEQGFGFLQVCGIFASPPSFPERDGVVVVAESVCGLIARFTHDQPTNALGNYYYAVALWKRGRGGENSANLQEAEALLQKAVSVDPKLGEAFVQLGVLYSARGNFPQAIGAYKKAIEVNPESGEAHYRLALVYKRVGQDEKSEQELQLYKQADKSETAAVEQQRREIRQFLIILQDQPQTPAPTPAKPEK